MFEKSKLSSGEKQSVENARRFRGRIFSRVALCRVRQNSVAAVGNIIMLRLEVRPTLQEAANPTVTFIGSCFLCMRCRLYFIIVDMNPTA